MAQTKSGGTSHKKVMKRELTTHDVMGIVGMAGSAINHPKLDEVPPNAPQNRWIMAIVGAFLETSRREFELLCAELIGIKPKKSFDDHKEDAKKEARKEAEDDAEYLENDQIKAVWRQYLLPDENIQQRVNDDILEQWGKTSPATLTSLINEVRNDPNFTELQSSLTELLNEGGIFSSSTETSSEESSDTSRSENS